MNETVAMKIIGITGGIGTGKSFVCNLFSALGAKVYNADLRAKQVMKTEPALIAALKVQFGDEVYLEDGDLNRAYLSSLVFSKPHLLEKLNGLVHPAVALDFLNWLSENKDERYVLKEAALIYETGGESSLDAVIVVDAPLELRIERVMKRDQVDRETVLQRINNQMPQEEKVAKADFLIVNDGTQLLTTQVHDLHKRFIA